MNRTTRGQSLTTPEITANPQLPLSQRDNLDITMSGTGSSSVRDVERLVPEVIGRYRVSRLLGEGGFGQVFKAFDDQLQRHVAIKLPLPHLITSESELNQYIEEARVLARLDHSGIVTVHDVGVTTDGLPYIVSAFIDGTNLAERMLSNPLNLRDGLKLMISIGRALGYVHSQGIVHRDVKPANILLNAEEVPFLADFGLALRDEIAQPGLVRVGTPAYMSPEQARGESHLVDGRSDIFSLGIVLYQMLTGKRPFSGSDHKSVVYSLLHQEARPPRQINESVPRDLERICLKTLAKQASQRYATAGDLVEDLAHFLESNATSNIAPNDRTATSGEVDRVPSEAVAGLIPRGLRSYDSHDADFFCRLLPGPRDRHWVPESIRFWQRQIESTDVADPPRVGVVYGPSGCGKSSFVKAGLIPQLQESTVTVFVEATRDDTELRLLRGIRKRCSGTQAKASLSETLAELRRSRTGTDKRLLLVIDQFEQWLHGRPDEQASQLATALRQCDGHRIQCLLLVRDDFWLALSRFMALIDVPVKQNYNAMLVDLFSVSHARSVLAEFGAAYDRLPKNQSRLSAEQDQFLDRAVAELSENGKVFPVRLSLFVEMIKTQPWVIGTLTNLGGIDGIGLQFLEESFSSALAPAAQRTHEPAVRNVLRKLLPEQGVNIKGNMQPEHLLLEASGYADQPSLFYEMMQILDTDLRLVTPTDPAGTTSSDDSFSQSSDGVSYFQLTHDFLVPAIQQWLTRKQRSTRRGRAELRLADYASQWAIKPSPKFAPSWFDCLFIRFWSSPKRWNSTERRMMRTTTRRHLTRTVAIGAACVLLIAAGWLLRSRAKANALVQQLQTARTQDAGQVLEEIGGQGSFAFAPLARALDSAPNGSRSELLNRLALLPQNPSQQKELVEKGLSAELPMQLLLRERLPPFDPDAGGYLLKTLDDPEAEPRWRMSAAILLAGDTELLADLAKRESDNPQWQRTNREIVDAMLQHATQFPRDNTDLIAGLEPVSSGLLDPLAEAGLQKNESLRRSIATAFLLQFLNDDPHRMLDFFLDASLQQQLSMYPRLLDRLHEVKTRIRGIAFSDIDEQLSDKEYDRLAKRKGVAAALLHSLGEGNSTWPLLKLTAKPHARSYLIHQIAPLGGEFENLLNRFAREPQVDIRRALLMVLGEFETTKIPESLLLQATILVRDAFENDPDVGIHSAAEWLLLSWNDRQWIQKTIARHAELAKDSRKNWYVNAHGQTMGVFDARKVSGIGYVFEISTKEVTVEQFQRFRPGHNYFQHRSPTADCPIGTTDWFICIEYCRWLSEELQADATKCYPEKLTPDDPDVAYDKVIRHGAFRLPTFAEWTYACAATTKSLRYYGSSNSLADEYFWYFDSSLNENGVTRYYPNGTKKPNDFGMFAMYDGVREWGHDKHGERRTVHGGSSGQGKDMPTTFEDAFATDLAKANNGFYGLRVARTVVADSE